MPTVSVPALADQLQQLLQLDAAQVKDLAGLQARTADAKALCTDLVRRGWLTAFQANLLLQGKGQDLIVGPYLLLDRLGEGGTGQVFRARHQHMKRLVALKVIRRELLADGDVIKRFYREVEVTGQVDSPHVVKAYDAGPVGANHLLAMEYIDGTDLAKLVAQSGPLSVAQACEFVRQAAMGLQHAHERGLVHRDIKPANLMVTKGAPPVLKVLDLGLARLHQTHDGGGLSVNGAVTMGTPDYLAPEQALDFHAADIRADIYSLGCVFHFLLAGEPPFARGTLAEKLMRHQQQPPPAIRVLRPEVPADVAATLAKMLAKAPEDRFQTPGDVAQALAGAGASPQKRLLPLALGGAALVAVLMVGGGIALVAVGNKGTAKPTVAQRPATPAAVPPPSVAATRPVPTGLAGKVMAVQGRDSVRDAVVDPRVPKANFGTHPKDMRLSRYPTDSSAFLMRFNLDKLNLPRGTPVARATLSFFVWDPHQQSACKVSAFEVLTPWDEATVQWAQPGPGRGWANSKGFTLGTDTGPAVGAVVVQPDVPGTDTAEPPIEYQLDVTAMVRDWVAGTRPNHGVAIATVSDPATDMGFNTRFQVYSSRNPKTSYGPLLTIQLGP